MSLEQTSSEALDKLAAGDPMAAFQSFRGVLKHPAESLDSTEKFSQALAVFGQISAQIAGEEFAATINKAAQQPDDPQALYDLGYALYEQSLFDVASTVLTRADSIVPGDPAIVSELVACLEGSQRCHEAVEVLQRYPDLVTGGPMFSYLLAFNGLMIGDIDLCRSTFAALQKMPLADENERAMAERIETFLNRADSVKEICSLDFHDLPGWHFVLTGGLLTLLSPYGYPDPMSGRFALIQDNYSTCREGIVRLQKVIAQRKLQPQVVYALADHDSQIFATAVGMMLGLPVSQYLEEGCDKPGIIVAYDFSNAQLVGALAEKIADQILFAHSLNWTEASPVVPEVVTQLHQTLIAPWGRTMKVNQETNQMETADPDERPVEEIAKDIINATPYEVEADGEESEIPSIPSALVDLVPFAEAHGRVRFYENSPVKSNRFA